MNIKIIPDNTIPVKLNRVTKTGKPGVQRVLRNGVLLPEVGGDVDISVPEKLSELENDLNLTELLQIDDALSATSKNPVQNKVVTVKYTELNNQIHDIQREMTTFAKASHTHTTADVTGLDTALTNANKVTDVKVNGTSVVTNKSANITVDSTLSTTSNNPIKNSTVAAKFNSVDSAISGKQDKLTFDSMPTADSTKPVTSGGVKSALDAIDAKFANKQNAIPNADKLSIDSSGIITAKNLPSYVDDVIEVYILADGSVSAGQNGWLYTEGASSYDVLSNEKGKIYVVVGKIANAAVSADSATDAGEYQNTQWRWTGSQYVKLTDGSGMSPITNSEIDAIVAQEEDV